MPVYNGEQYVADAVESVLAQTYKNVEIVIVNDGSTDASHEKVLPYLHLPNLQYVEQQNKGVAAARNAGIRAATGELIAFLDQDDLWLPDKLAGQVAYLSKNPDVLLVHANQGHIDENGEAVEIDWPTDACGNCFREMFVQNRIAVLTVLMRRECFEKVGFFNEKLSGSDDYEMWLRVARQAPIGYLNQRVALYRFHGSNVSRDHFKMTRTDFAAIQSIVNQFPDVARLVGKGAVKLRLGDLAYSLGCWYGWSARDHQVAKKYFLLSIKQRPFHLASYRKFFWCSLTNGERRALSWYWSKATKLCRLSREEATQIASGK